MSDPAYPGPPPAYSTYNKGQQPGGAPLQGYSQQYGPPPGQQYGPPQGQLYPSAKQGPPPGHVVRTQPVMIMQPQPQGAPPPNYMYLGMFTAFCCNIIFGILAVWMGHKSQQSANYGDYETAKKKGQHSLIFSIIGIIVGIATIAGMVVWYCFRFGVL